MAKPTIWGDSICHPGFLSDSRSVVCGGKRTQERASGYDLYQIALRDSVTGERSLPAGKLLRWLFFHRIRGGWSGSSGPSGEGQMTPAKWVRIPARPIFP